MSPSPFSAEGADAVCRHMNADHRAEAVRICRALGGVPDAVDAEAVGVDAGGMRFRVRSGGTAAQVVEVAFARPVDERAEVRGAVVELYRRACAAAGVPTTGH